MSEWKELNLNEVYDFGSGLSKSADQFGYGYGFLTFKDVFHNYFLPQSLSSLANTSEKERQTCSIKAGDVFLTRTSETQEELGMSSVALMDYPDATFNGFTKRLRPKKNIEILPEYAGYYFRSPKFRGLVTSMASMTTRASLNNDMLSALKIVLPKLEIQESIASTLKAFDDKIDLLHRQNVTLEKMAEIMFRQWFVERTDESWHEKQLSEYFQFWGGFSFKSKDYLQEGIFKIVTIKNVQDGYLDLTSTARLNSIPEKVKPYQILREGDILMSLTGNVGRVCIVDDKNCLLNQRIAKIETINPNWKPFAYFYFRQRDMIERLTYLSKGSAQLNLSPVDTLRQVDIFGNDSIIDGFCETINPLFKKVMTNKAQIRTLTQLRDTLLPKLMSGEIKVKE